MREIKFRAWDYGNKEMVIVTSIGFWGSLPDGDGVKDVNSGLWHCPLMQYTGLKDKNGKEIYEGDVLEIIKENDSDHGFYIPVGTTVVVKWMDGGFRLIKPEHYNNDKNGFCKVCASVDYLYSENHEIDIGFFTKIIGNIYSNPELTK